MPRARPANIGAFFDVDKTILAENSGTGRAYLRKLKRHAFISGVDLICVSTHQSFVNPNPDEVTKNVEHTIKCTEIAYELGAPCIRINTGRWGTSKDFDELMKNRGIEPVLPLFH